MIEVVQAADYFKQLPLFSDLSPEEIVDVLRIARMGSFEPGDKLMARGERGDWAFVIEQGEGSVRVVDSRGEEVEVARVGPGEVLGELSLVDGQPRSADVVASTRISGYRIDRAEFERMRKALDPAAFKMMRRMAITVSDRLRDINEVVSKELVRAPASKGRGGKDPRKSTMEPGRVSRAQMRVTRSQLQRPSMPPGQAGARASGRPPAAAGTEGGGFWSSMKKRISGMTFK
ncbi:MAG: cyclic nucleotide-binding domain-containing protein [Myxococcales bacterium]|jgi:CRP-like cAMP-binding protein